MRVILPILAAALLLGGCALPFGGGGREELSLLDRYDLVAFRDDRGHVIEQAIKWRDAVPYTLEGLREYSGFAADHLDRLADLTGLSIRQADAEAGPDRLRVVMAKATMTTTRISKGRKETAARRRAVS